MGAVSRARLLGFSKSLNFTCTMEIIIVVFTCRIYVKPNGWHTIKSSTLAILITWKKALVLSYRGEN